MDKINVHKAGILVADDSVDDLRLIVEILGRQGYNIRPALNGEAALETIRAESPDLILLDVRMPKMNGFQVCRRLKSDPSFSAIPVIFLSASGNLEDTVKAFSAGAVDYITKPYRPEEVLARVATHLSINFLKKKIEAKNEALSREIIERKQIAAKLITARQDAEAASLAKSLFMANMSHELRTPLNNIIGLSQLLVSRHSGELNEFQEKYLNDILNSGWHLLSLIDDILDISSLEIGKMDLRLSIIDLPNLLEACLSAIKEKTMEFGIKVIMDMGDIPRTISADERLLKQVLHNLLANAVKFSPEGGDIHLKAELVPGSGNMTSGDLVRVSVVDPGIGLKSEEIERIFEAFEQADMSHTRKFGGTGLGLAFSKRIIELHGGQLRAESAGEGKGSTFSFDIPVDQESGPNRPAESSIMASNKMGSGLVGKN